MTYSFTTEQKNVNFKSAKTGTKMKYFIVIRNNYRKISIFFSKSQCYNKNDFYYMSLSRILNAKGYFDIQCYFETLIKQLS